MDLPLKRLWDRARESYWFVPGTMTLTASGLAALTLWIDQLLRTGALTRPWEVGLVDADGARVLLSTISSSSITVAGLVFSITIVVLNSASSQFGPRLVSNFMDHLGTQIVLGTFLGSFVFALVALAAVRNDAVPEISVTLGVLLGVLSFLVLIYFIHHVSVFIQAERVVADISAELAGALRETFPEREEEDPAEGTAEADLPAPALATGAASIQARESGYVEAIARDRLLRIAVDRDLTVQLLLRPGDFVIALQQAAWASPAERVDDETAEELAGCLLMAEHRRGTEDPEYALRQLVEIAVRALSPGVNDPFTAISCIDHLAAALAEAARRSPPESRLTDDDGNPRVFLRPRSWDGLLDTAFQQIRQNASGIPSVTIRLAEALGWIADSTELPVSYRRAVARQLEAILESGRESIVVKGDREALEARYRKARRALARQEGAAGETVLAPRTKVEPTRPATAD